MKISVIIPVYNRLEHLKASFLCLLRQERQPDELIITDDGSSQKVLDFIGDLLPKAKFKVKHIFQEDKGFRKTRALNNAVRISDGDLLVFCDQDLIYGEKYLKTIEENIKENIFLMGRAYLSTEIEKYKILSKIETINDYSELMSEISSSSSLEVKNLISKDKKRRLLNFLKFSKRGIRLIGMSYAIFKSDYIKVNGYDEKYIGWGEEDDDFGNRLYVAGIKGKEFITPNIQIHLWHYFDPSKKKSPNEKYYYERKKIIFKEKKYLCDYGFNNPSDSRKDVTLQILN